jgi:uncharacterized membrane protein
MVMAGLLAFVVMLTVGTLPSAAWAYFGPGAGVTMLGALWGVLLAVAFALFAFLAWPVRAMLRRRNKAAEAASAAATDASR